MRRIVAAALIAVAITLSAGLGRIGATYAAPVLDPTGPSAPLASQTGIASWYGPGTGVAMPFCTWTYRTTHGCGLIAIQSLDTGIVAIAPVIDYCQCFVGTPQERLVDLQLGVVAALGLDPARGIFPVTIWPTDGTTTIPDTAMEAPGG